MITEDTPHAHAAEFPYYHFHQVITAIRENDFSRFFDLEWSFEIGSPYGYVRLTEKAPRPTRPKPEPVAAWFVWSSLAGWLIVSPRDELVSPAGGEATEDADDILSVAGDLCAAADDESHPDYPGVH